MAEAGFAGMDGIGGGQTLVSNRVDEVLRIEGSEALLPWSEADPESLRELQEFEDAFREVRTELEAAASPKLGCPRAHRRVTLLR